MSDQDFGELRADIAANGLNNAITMFEGMVLDGWHRYLSCQQTGTRPKFQEFAGDGAAARRYVVSANLMRRHLDTSQRAMIGGRFAEMGHGGDRKSGDQEPKSALNPAILTIKEAADLVNVGKEVVKDARIVIKHADPETIAKVERGEISVSRAAKDLRASTPKPVRKPPPPVRPQYMLGGGGRTSPSQPIAQQPELASPQTVLVEPSPLMDIAPRTVPQWIDMSDRDKRAHLEHRNTGAKLNRQEAGEDDNAIDWAKWTWNPVTGCLHSCPYCYARDIANRFSGTPAFPNGFAPTLRVDRLSAPLNGTPRASEDLREKRIFTGSMTDLFGRWVPAEWIETVLGIAQQASQWDFLMLTKFLKRMSEFGIPPNVWMGTSVDCQARVAAAEAAFAKVTAKVKWLSCEPLIEPIKFQHLDRFDLLVIGGASASSKTPQWIPPFTWLDDLMRQAQDAGCSVFLKSNLYRKEQPNGPRYQMADRAPDVFHYLTRTSSPDREVEAAQ